MTNDELAARLDDLKKAIDNLYQKLGYPSWDAHKRQARQNEELRAHESRLASGR
jgi:hypothetical protein